MRKAGAAQLSAILTVGMWASATGAQVAQPRPPISDVPPGGVSPGEFVGEAEGETLVRPLRTEFLERNYFLWNLPPIGPDANRPLFFEAHVAPHFYLFNELPKTDFQRYHDRWLHAFSFTMQFRIRMVGDTSTPVRPPSYMPRFNWQSFVFWGKESNNDWLDMLEARLSLGHHSNGQQYCRFDENRRVPDPEKDPGLPPCPPVDPDVAPNQQTLNVRSGDFATDYLQLAVHEAWIEIEGGYEVQRWAIGLIGETNPLWLDFLPGAIDEETHAMYGPHRVRLEGEHSRDVAPPYLWQGTARVAGSVELFSDTAPEVARYRVLLEGSYVPYRFFGLGVFARFFAGQDYLNILYLRPPVKTLQLGIIWDFSVRPRFKFQPGH
jgi:hypothetical protein